MATIDTPGEFAESPERADDPLTTATLRMNLLRQFFAGDQSRYVGTALRVGPRTGVAESKAIGADG